MLEMSVDPGQACATIIPDATYYFANIDHTTLVLIITSGLFTLLSCLLFIVHFVVILNYVSSSGRAAKLAWLALIFPLTSCVCLVGLCIPRAMPLVDIVIIMYFGRCLLGFIELINHEYFPGRHAMLSELRDYNIKLTTLPICCLCSCLPRFKPTRAILRRLEFMVYQAAVVRPLVVFTYCCFWANRNGNIRSGFGSSTTFMTIFNVASTMTAMWGLNILMTLYSRPLQRFSIVTQFRLVCLVLLLFSFQGNIFSILSSTFSQFNIIPCDSLLSSTARGDVLHYFLLVIEMFSISLVVTIFLRPTKNAVFDLHPAAALLDSDSVKCPIKEDI